MTKLSQELDAAFVDVELEGLDEQEEVLSGSKWYRTRMCGCGECRFKPASAVCPQAASPKAIQLWAINSDYIGYKDYVDPFVTVFPLPQVGVATTPGESIV